MKHSLFKSLRAELIFYVAVSMFLSVITEFACGVGLYILSTALGISYRGYGRSDMNIVGRKAGEHIPYVFWSMHEEKEGVFNWEWNRNLRKVLS